jgi:hypothetical protein
VTNRQTAAIAMIEWPEISGEIHAEQPGMEPLRWDIVTPV